MNQALAVSQSAPTFPVGQAVVAKGQQFWMTVTRVLPGGRLVCGFGQSGRFAGVYAAHELRRCNGDPIGREKFEAEVNAALEARGIPEDKRPHWSTLASMFYSAPPYTVERAVAEIVRGQP